MLLNASLIGAGALTLSTSYAFGDVFGTKSSLHRRFADAKRFYAIFTAHDRLPPPAIVLIPGAPLGVITESVQALAGVLLPSASVFLLLLCNDREVLGPWRNPPLAERARERDRRDARAALADPDGDDRVPEHRRHQGRAHRRRAARSRARRVRTPDAPLTDDAPRPSP